MSNDDLSEKAKKNEAKNENVQMDEAYLCLGYSKSDLPGVVQTSSLKEIKKPRKSDESHNDES